MIVTGPACNPRFQRGGAGGFDCQALALPIAKELG